MNGEGEYSSVAESYAYLRRDFVTGVDFGSSYGPGGYYPDISMGFIPTLPQAFFELPPVLYEPTETSPTTDDSATPGPEALPPSVVDPELGAQETVYEGAEAPTATRTRETDWDWVYDRYVVLNEPTLPENDVPFHDTIDWGEVAGGILGGILDPFGVGAGVRTAISGPPVVGGIGPGITSTIPAITPGAVMPANGCPPYGPKYAKICLATNVITPLRRRRRRRLLTSSDIKDLSALKSIVGGAALQAAVTQAVRR